MRNLARLLLLAAALPGCALLGDPHTTFAECARMCRSEGLVMTGRVHHGNVGSSCVCETPRSLERSSGGAAIVAASRR